MKTLSPFEYICSTSQVCFFFINDIGCVCVCIVYTLKIDQYIPHLYVYTCDLYTCIPVVGSCIGKQN